MTTRSQDGDGPTGRGDRWSTRGVRYQPLERIGRTECDLRHIEEIVLSAAGSRRLVDAEAQQDGHRLVVGRDLSADRDRYLASRSGAHMMDESQ